MEGKRGRRRGREKEGEGEEVHVDKWTQAEGRWEKEGVSTVDAAICTTHVHVHVHIHDYRVYI